MYLTPLWHVQGVKTYKYPYIKASKENQKDR